MKLLPFTFRARRTPRIAEPNVQWSREFLRVEVILLASVRSWPDNCFYQLGRRLRFFLFIEQCRFVCFARRAAACNPDQFLCSQPHLETATLRIAHGLHRTDSASNIFLKKLKQSPGHLSGLITLERAKDRCYRR